MACRVNHNNLSDVMELISERGFDGLGDAVALLINQAMEIERRGHLNAQPYERSDERTGYANEKLKSRLGELDLMVPQVRDSSFYPSALERGIRSERALKLAVAEMYVKGVSTRKVKDITEQLCGLEISSSDVSRAAKLLDEGRSKPETVALTI